VNVKTEQYNREESVLHTTNTRAGTALILAAIAAASFGIAILVQVSAGALHNSFTAYPDEPSHFLASVMLRDYLARPVAHPLEFARDYYNHYPYFAIGYWPPFFYIMTGAWLLLAGVGRAQALIMSAAGATISATAIADLTRRSAGWPTGAAAALVYLSLTEVQYWLCTVMVDQWVCAFGLVASILLVRSYSGHRYAMLGLSLVTALAILTKYSGLFIIAFPLAAILVPQGRWRPTRLLYLALIAILVMPWMISTSPMAFTGLPKEHAGALLSRGFQCLREIFRILPLGLAGVVAGGLVVILVRFKAQTVPVRVMALGCLCLAGFVAASPVEMEHRYLLFGVASLLIMAFSALAPVFARVGRAGSLILPAFAVLFAGMYLTHFQHSREVRIRPMVDLVAANPAWAGKRIVVPSDLEGATIAEFAIADRHRPGYILQRPSKMFATQDWFGRNYSLRSHNAAEMMAQLTAEPVQLVIVHENDPASRLAHEVMLREMLDQYSDAWHLRHSSGEWRIYEYTPQN